MSDLRRFGSAAIDLSWIACGRADAYFEFNLSPWDVAAGWLLVEEAGGKVASTFSGKLAYVEKTVHETVATNRRLHVAVLKNFLTES